MVEDKRYKIKDEKWFPRFEHPINEREFIQEFNAEALKSAKVGIFIILVVWSGFALFDMQLDSNARASALFFRFLVATPLLLVIAAALYSRYAVSFYQIIAVAGLFIIEASIYHVVGFYDFKSMSHAMGLAFPMNEGDGKSIFLFVWFLIIFLSSVILRFNSLQSLLNALIYIFFNILTIYIYHPSKLFVIIAVPFLAAILPVVWLGSLHVQQYARENFRALKLLDESMQKSEGLLLNILPLSIANRLKKTPGTIADGFNDVSVLFADIVGFTRLSGRYDSEVIVQLLNEVFRKFDSISKKYGVEKIKTIGDAYMLAAGVPEAQTNHCNIVADCALDMIAAVKNISDPSGNPIQIRVGIHTGPAIAGVIGTHKFSYDLWGDTVNTASRMESHGDGGKIQVSREIYESLKDTFVFEPRDEIEIKGKGRMQTWWLTGRSDISN
ncbi:adenylate/guanylate cyclase domain-containing protein [Thermodesulfobacteriota bacterium]